MLNKNKLKKKNILNYYVYNDEAILNLKLFKVFSALKK